MVRKLKRGPCGPSVTFVTSASRSYFPGQKSLIPGREDSADRDSLLSVSALVDCLTDIIHGKRQPAGQDKKRKEAHDKEGGVGHLASPHHVEIDAGRHNRRHPETDEDAGVFVGRQADSEPQ